ncbi:MAG: 7-cyano-7-deazaguanine synthase QueC [Candidatus Omnitrophica bacterium]|nr:7-cyano-7-deazaguanine synthase QueC [Candidatus Omnitrophota bacterium]
MSKQSKIYKKAVVLLSGGLDSSTTLFEAIRQGFRCFCLSFDYGQRHKKELVACRRITEYAKVPLTVLKITLPWKGSSLIDYKLKIPVAEEESFDKKKAIPNTYVPARNIIFLSYAVSYAEAIGAEAIFIGANAVDYSGYPDCRSSFYRVFRKLVSVGTKTGAQNKKIEIKTPLINLTKAQIIERGIKLGVPYQLTWSCYRGKKHPCQSCDSCLWRKKGFKEAGIKDPLLL